MDSIKFLLTNIHKLLRIYIAIKIPVNTLTVKSLSCLATPVHEDLYEYSSIESDYCILYDVYKIGYID